MGLYLIILFVGIALVIIAVAFLSGGNKSSNIISNDSSSSSQRSIVNKGQNTNSRSAFFANEILQELEDSSEELLKKISSKEMELEGLLGKADHKISRLNELLEREERVLEYSNKLTSTGGISEGVSEKANSKLSIPGNREKVSELNNSSGLTTYTPGKLIANSNKQNNKQLTNTHHDISSNIAYPNNNTSKNETVSFIPKYLNKHRPVIDYYNDGFSLTEIAQKTDKGKGEVQLILNLYKQSGEANHEN